MASQAGPIRTAAGDDARGSQISSVPLLGEGFSESNVKSTLESTGSDREQEAVNSPELDSKNGKRRFWGLGKKKDEMKPKSKREIAIAGQATTSTAPGSGIQLIPSLGSPQRPIMVSPPVPTSHLSESDVTDLETNKHRLEVT